MMGQDGELHQVLQRGRGVCDLCDRVAASPWNSGREGPKNGAHG